MLRTTSILMPGGKSTVTLQPVLQGGSLSMLATFHAKDTGDIEGTTEMFPPSLRKQVPENISSTLKKGSPSALETLHEKLITFFVENSDRVAVQEFLLALQLRAQGENITISPQAEAVLVLMHSIDV